MKTMKNVERLPYSQNNALHLQLDFDDSLLHRYVGHHALVILQSLLWLQVKLSNNKNYNPISGKKFFVNLNLNSMY